MDFPSTTSSFPFLLPPSPSSPLLPSYGLEIQGPTPSPLPRRLSFDTVKRKDSSFVLGSDVQVKFLNRFRIIGNIINISVGVRLHTPKGREEGQRFIFGFQCLVPRSPSMTITLVDGGSFQLIRILSLLLLWSLTFDDNGMKIIEWSKLGGLSGYSILNRGEVSTSTPPNH